MQLLWLRHLQTADPGATLPGGDAGLTPPRGTARAMPWAGSGTCCACGCAAAARGPGAGGDGGALVSGCLVRPGASGTPTPAENRLTAVQQLRPPPVPLRPGAGAGLGAIPPGEVTGADGSLLRVFPQSQGGTRGPAPASFTPHMPSPSGGRKRIWGLISGFVYGLTFIRHRERADDRTTFG